MLKKVTGVALAGNLVLAKNEWLFATRRFSSDTMARCGSRFKLGCPNMAVFEEILVMMPDGYEAYARYWSPPDPRGAVLFHHGIQSHCGWYEGSASYLFKAGYAVLQVDRRGCGRNETGRGHADSADQLIGDTLAARDELARRVGTADHHVVGVSWGGKLAVVAYAKDPAGVQSLSLVTPGLFPRMGVSKETRAQIGFAMIYEPERLFDIPLNEPELFTAEPEWQAFFRTDPLTLRECTASFFLASRRMDKTVSRFGQAPPVPIHLFLAGDERVIENAPTEAFVLDLGRAENRITHYPDSRHSLEFEVCRENFCRDLVGFINECPAP